MLWMEVEGSSDSTECSRRYFLPALHGQEPNICHTSIPSIVYFIMLWPEGRNKRVADAISPVTCILVRSRRRRPSQWGHQRCYRKTSLSAVRFLPIDVLGINVFEQSLVKVLVPRKTPFGMVVVVAAYILALCG